MRERLPVEARNMRGVIREATQPVASGREGLNTLKVIATVKDAAATRRVIEIV